MNCLNNLIKPDPLEAKSQAEIQHILTQAWDFGVINEEDRKQFLRLISERKNRSYFFSCLNKYRILGMFIMGEKSYNILAELLHKILDEIYKDRDYESAKSCMILSQTFYRISSDIHLPKFYLQMAIDHHGIWRDMEFWEQIIKSSILLIKIGSINEELHSFNIRGSSNVSESSEDKSSRVQNVVFGQMVSFTQHMMFFEVPKEKAKDLVKNINKAYSLSDEIMGYIITNINDYTNVIQTQVKDEIIHLATHNLCETTKKNIDVDDPNLVKNIMDWNSNEKLDEGKNR